MARDPARKKVTDRAASKRYHDKNRDKHRIALIMYRAKARAQRKGVPFSLTLADIPAVPEFCPVLGVRLISETTGRTGPRPFSPALDRIVPALGYVPGNVQWLSHRANCMKSNASPDELRAFATWVSKEYP